MLVLTRKVGEKIIIGDIVVTVTEIRGDRVRLGIDAPRSINIARGELLDKPVLAGTRGSNEQLREEN